MSAIGLLVLRLFIARPSARDGPSRGLTALTRATVIACVLALIAIPVYLDFAIAEDSLRSVFDLGALVPLYRVTAFGRGYVDLEICFALLTLAAMVALWLDRPERARRSVAELAAGTGVVAAIAAVLLVPPTIGHAGQTSPRGLSVLFDFLHLVSGSVWIGGLIGLLVLWRAVGAERRVAALGVVVPRFSAVALTAVIVLLISGTGSTVVHMPAINALWDTGYGVAILVKIGLLAAAVALASGNLLRARPGLAAARRDPARGRHRGGAAAPAGVRGGDHRHRCGVHGGGAVEPRPAAAGLRTGQLRAGPRRPGPRRGDGHPQRLHAAGARVPQQSRRPGQLRAADHPPRRSGPRRHGDARLQSPADGDAPADLRPARGQPGRLPALGARSDHGRAVEP